MRFLVTFLVGAVIWFAVAIPVALVIGRVIARRDRDIPPPPRPHP